MTYLSQDVARVILHLCKSVSFTPSKPTIRRLNQSLFGAIPDLMVEVQLVDRGTANRVRDPTPALSEIRDPGVE